MDIGVTQVGAVNTGDDDNSIPIEGVVLVAGRIYLALLYTSGAGSSPIVTGISGTGLTMEKVTTTGDAENDIDGGNANVEAWIGKCSASGTVTVTVALDGTSDNSDVVIYELTGVNNSTALSAIVQAVCETSGGSAAEVVDFTLNAFANAKNRPLAFVMHRRNEATDENSGAGYTELLDAVHNDPQSAFAVQWHDTSPDVDPDFTWATSSEYGGIAFELAVLPEPPIAVLVQRPRRREKRPQPRRRELRFAEWFPFPPAQSLGVVSFAKWSREVELVEGDEIRITLAGPAADQPQARLSLGFKQVH